MKKRLYEIIDLADTEGTVSRLYDIFMMVTIILSWVPLAVKSDSAAYIWLDRAIAAIFIVDYALRWYTADIEFKKGKMSYVIYPITPMALVDLLSVMPTVMAIGSTARALRVLSAYGMIRVLRVVKLARYSKNLMIFRNVFRKQRKAFLIVFLLALFYVLISALLIFNIEPETFNTYFDAIYWAIVSLTGVGYGDLYAVTVGGKIITMISALFGIAIVALPAGIITAGYMEEVYSGRLSMLAGQLEEDLELHENDDDNGGVGIYDAGYAGYSSINHACDRPHLRGIRRRLSGNSTENSLGSAAGSSDKPNDGKAGKSPKQGAKKRGKSKTKR